MSDTINEQPENLQEEPKESKKSESSGSNFYKQKLEQMQKEREELLGKLNSIEESRLKEKENYKALWETEKNKREEAEGKAKRIAENYFNGLKFSAIEKEAVKLGIRNEALDDLKLLDTSMVEIETTSTGNANIINAKEFVEMVKEKKTHWFKTGNAPNINTNGGGEFTPKTLSAKELLDLEKKDPAKYREEIKKRMAPKRT